MDLLTKKQWNLYKHEFPKRLFYYFRTKGYKNRVRLVSLVIDNTDFYNILGTQRTVPKVLRNAAQGTFEDLSAAYRDLILPVNGTNYDSVHDLWKMITHTQNQRNLDQLSILAFERETCTHYSFSTFDTLRPDTPVDVNWFIEWAPKTTQPIAICDCIVASLIELTVHETLEEVCYAATNNHNGPPKQKRYKNYINYFGAIDKLNLEGEMYYQKPLWPHDREKKFSVLIELDNGTKILKESVSF